MNRTLWIVSGSENGISVRPRIFTVEALAINYYEELREQKEKQYRTAYGDNFGQDGDESGFCYHTTSQTHSTSEGKRSEYRLDEMLISV